MPNPGTEAPPCVGKQLAGRTNGKAVPRFKYLGRILAQSDSDWPALYKNVAKARQKWARLSRLLRAEGVSPKTAVWFYTAVVVSVLLFGSESWVCSQAMVQTMEGFHNSVVRSLAR
mmetsp:Transcript_4486/g.12483  ORF Transcript_4486/g.12483 Transcript_4486/m.12483 type:complete len:116 (+) Transcript_4486:328-675(+)